MKFNEPPYHAEELSAQLLLMRELVLKLQESEIDNEQYHIAESHILDLIYCLKLECRVLPSKMSQLS